MDEVILATANVSGFSWGGTGSDAAKTSVEREGEKKCFSHRSFSQLRYSFSAPQEPTGTASYAG